MALPGVAGFNKATKAATQSSSLFTKGLGGMVNGFKKLTGSADQAKNGLNQGRDAMGRFTSAGEGLSGLGPYGAAIAAGLAIGVVAIIAATTALLAMASAAISVIETRSKMLSVFSALGGGAAAGKATVAMVDNLASKLPFATDQISGWAQSLQAAGLSGDKLKSAVTAVASATALMGDSGGAAAEKMIKQLAEGGQAADKMMKQIQEGSPKSARLLAEMGLRIEDVAKAAGMSVEQFKKAHLSADQMNDAVQKAMVQKGKGPLAEMALTFPAMIMKIKEGFFSLFEKLGPAVKPFMKAIQGLFGLFGKGSADMKKLQTTVTAVFKPLFGIATAVAKVLKSMFAGFGGTAKGASGGIVSMLESMNKFANSAEGMAMIKSVIKGIGYALAAVGVVFAVLGVIVAAIGAALYAVFIYPIQLAIEAMVGLYDAGKAAFNGISAALSGFDLGATVVGWIVALVQFADGAAAAAGNFISGLVGGISAGASQIIAAVANLAKSALGAFKSILGIASPSKVMAKMGGHFTAGAAEGIDAGANKVEDSAASLGDAAKGGAAKGMSGGKGKGGKGGVTINGGVHIEVPMGTPTAWAEEAYALFIERLAASQGV